MKVMFVKEHYCGTPNEGVGIITDISSKGGVTSVNLGSPNAKNYQGLRNAYLRQTGRNIAPLPQLAIPANNPIPVPVAGSEDDPLRVWRLQLAARPSADPLLDTPLAAQARAHALQQLDNIHQAHLALAASGLPVSSGLYSPDEVRSVRGNEAFLGQTATKR